MQELPPTQWVVAPTQFPSFRMAMSGVFLLQRVAPTKMVDSVDLTRLSEALAEYDMSANPLRINTKHPEWYIKEHMIYPPFKQGLYLEEYFFKHMSNENQGGILDREGRTYFPLFWTNYQLSTHASTSQLSADIEEYMQLHPPIHPEKGYFTLVQHDDGPLVVHPHIHVYGASQSHKARTPLPLIYEDQNYTLAKAHTTNIEDQHLLCSFVGRMTHEVRNRMLDVLSKNPPDLVVEGFQPSDQEQHRQDDIYVHVQHWTPTVSSNDASLFIHITRHSKFTLAPRGYGIQSYRFYEAFELGSIPVYIHDTPPTDLWLPYQDRINYHDICIVVHVSDIDTLISRLRSITPEQYRQMRENYHNIKHMFTLDYMCEYIRRNHA